MLKEFREFAMKGNMMDLAIGLIVGTAFGAIVSSLVKDVLMPPLGALIGGLDFSNLLIVLKEGKEAGPYLTPDAASKAGAVTLNYGLFLNAVVSFIIIAFALFFVVKAINRLKAKEEAAPAAVAELPREVVLLEEIRDLLKKS